MRAGLGARLVGLSLVLLGCPSTREQAGEGSPSRASKQAEDTPSVAKRALSEEQQAAAELIRPDGTIFAETELMGTRVSVNVWLGEERSRALAAKGAMTAAIEEMARIEDIASEWQASSDLSRINASSGEPVEVPPELLEILARAAEVSAASEGLFDVSFYSVGRLWSFRPGAKPPSAEAIAAALPAVDWRAIELDRERNTVRLTKPGVGIGLGAIAKGYAVDRAAAKLHEAGFDNHIVEAGGDTKVSGSKGETSWRVGVQDPERDAGQVGYIPVRNEAVVTSGNYKRFFDWEGVRYTHILDPRTGWPIPVERSPKSVTLVAANATDADAYCTAVSVMPPEEGLKFVDAREGLEAVIIAPDGRLLVSAGLEERFVEIAP